MKPIKPFPEEILGKTPYNPYDPNLPAAFDHISTLIHDKFPELRIEHVGSSSVPGIGGRNAIDMVIPVDSEKHNEIRAEMYNLGFNDSPWDHYIPVLTGKLDFSGKEYPILLYIVSPDSPMLPVWLTYRNHMRSHPEDAASYDQEKQRVVNSGASTSDEYQRGKTPFIMAMVEKINQNRNLK